MWGKKMDSYAAVPPCVGDTSTESLDYFGVYEIIVVLCRGLINATTMQMNGLKRILE